MTTAKGGGFLSFNKINERESKYGINIFNKIPKATNEEKEKFSKWFSKYSKREINDYVEFIIVLNGLFFHESNFLGLYLYSLNEECQFNIYKKNEEWHYNNEDYGKYIFFGDGGIDLYCLNIEDGKYYVLDKHLGEIEKFETFNELIIKALEDAL
jgi:hypothetical protein